MIETVGVLAIVAVVLVLAGRSIYRRLTGRKKGLCCGCDSCIRTDGAPCLSRVCNRVCQGGWEGNEPADVCRGSEEHTVFQLSWK